MKSNSFYYLTLGNNDTWYNELQVKVPYYYFSDSCNIKPIWWENVIFKGIISRISLSTDSEIIGEAWLDNILNIEKEECCNFYFAVGKLTINK